MTTPEAPASAPARNRLAGFVRLVIIPILVLAIIMVPSFRILQSSRNTGIEARVTCQMRMIKAGTEPADVLLVGSSRTGAGIDPILLEEQFDGDLETAEKAVLTKGSEYDRSLLYRTYTKYRGVPRVLGIQISVDRAERTEPEPSLNYPTDRTFQVFETDVQADMLADLRDRGDANLFNTYVKNEYISEAGFFLTRLDVGADFALRAPTRALNPDEDCTWGTRALSGRWVLGNSKRYFEGETPVPDQATRDQWVEESANFRPVDPNDPYTADELALMHELVDKAYSDGVERVVLFYIPSAGERPEIFDPAWFEQEFPNVTVMDGREAIADDELPGLKWQFFNLNHVNRIAAYYLTMQMLGYVQGDES